VKNGSSVEGVWFLGTPSFAYTSQRNVADLKRGEVWFE